MAPRLSVRRRAGSLVGILVVSSLALLPASPAWAARPDIVRIPGGSFSDILGQGQCAFPVRLDFVARQGLIQVFSNGDGAVRAVHLAGSLNGTFTRILDDGSDGPDLRLNFSGPGNIDPATGDLSGTGPWLLASPDDPNTPESEGFALLVKGSFSLSTDPDTGVVTILSTTGRVTDICAALAITG